MPVKTDTPNKLVENAPFDIKEDLTQKPRVLFGFERWMSGVMDVASWAKHQGVADPVVFQLNPGDDRMSEAREFILSKKGEWNFPGKLLNEEGELSEKCVAAVHSLGLPFIKELVETKPDVVGFRFERDDLKIMKDRIDSVRLFSNTKIVIGGPTPTIYGKTVLENTGADYAFAGEAEESFAQFSKIIGKKDKTGKLPLDAFNELADIPGLMYRWGGKTYHNTIVKDGYGQSNLDDNNVKFLGFNGKDLIELERTPRSDLRYRDKPFTSKTILEENTPDYSIVKNLHSRDISIMLISGRGCPGDCNFCHRIHDKVPRQLSPKELVKRIRQLDNFLEEKEQEGEITLKRKRDVFDFEEFEAVLPYRTVGILDDDFLVSRKRAIEFFKHWDSPENKDLTQKFNLTFQTNPVNLVDNSGNLDDELFGYIKKFKPYVSFGVESFNQEVLKRYHKRHRLGEAKTVLDAMDGLNREYTVDMIIGDSESTPQEFAENLLLFMDEALKRPNLRPVVNIRMAPYPTTDFGKSLEFSGRLVDLSKGVKPNWIDGDRSQVEVKSFEKYSSVHPELNQPLTRGMMWCAIPLQELRDHPEKKLGVFDRVMTRMDEFLTYWQDNVEESKKPEIIDLKTVSKDRWERMRAA